LSRKAKVLVIGLFAIIFLTVPMLPPSPGELFIWDPYTQPRFVIASWDFPDEYGQGIEGFFLYGNSSGSWVSVDGYYTYDDDNIFNWTVGEAIKLECYTWFSSTLTGATSAANGKNFQRHNVNVRNGLGETVFSKQNFTYYSCDTGIDPPLWFYEYYVVLNFLPVFGEYYTVTITYEVFW